VSDSLKFSRERMRVIRRSVSGKLEMAERRRARSSWSISWDSGSIMKGCFMSEETQEEWRAVVGWEGLYEVSSLGRVRSLARRVAYSDGRMRCFPEIIMTPGKVGAGYLSLTLKQQGRKFQMSVHRLVCMAFIGPQPNGLQVNHIDGNKENNAISNLEYITKSYNQLHRHWVLGQDRGEKHSNSKLKNDDVIKILKLLESGMSQTLIAKMYGVTQGNIYSIFRGTSWGWLTGRSPAPSLCPSAISAPVLDSLEFPLP